MLRKINIFFKNNFLLLFTLISFSSFVLPACFINNDYLILVASEHIDSGSLLGGIISILSSDTPSTFYNQNIPFHTLYGFLYNSALFWTFFLITKIFNLDLVNNFNIIATVARLTNYILALFIIIETYRLTNKFIKNLFLKIILLSVMISFPAFIHYSYHIKSDLLGLFLVFLSFKYLYKFINDNKSTKNIIIANVLGGLAVLCKQPYVFIALPLLIGYLSSFKKNRINIKNIFSTYLKTFTILFAIFFVVHPYAFINVKAFIKKQQLLTQSTSSVSINENISVWTSMYSQDSILLLSVITPIIFLILTSNKKSKDKSLFFLKLILIYITTYIVWLTTKVGPIRVQAYFLPVIPFSVILFFYSFNINLHNIFDKTSIIKKIINIPILILLLFLSIKSINQNISISSNFIDNSHNYKKSIQYQTTQQFVLHEINSNTKEKKVIHSITLPVSNNLFKNTKNTWQFSDENNINSYEPDYVFIDFTAYWEKPYEYWKDIAKQNNLTKETLFLKNQSPKKNIILFY